MTTFFSRFIIGPALAILRPLGRWLVADWRNLPLLFLLLFAAAHHFIIDPGLRDERDKARVALEAEKDAHLQTIANFVQASRLAEARQAANVTRVAGEQATITERIEHDYEKRIAAVRARADALAQRLRSEAPADPGLSGGADLPGSGTTSGGLAETAGNFRLPASLDLGQRLTCTLQAEQLNSLISWNIAQAAVITTPVETAQ